MPHVLHLDDEGESANERQHGPIGHAAVLIDASRKRVIARAQKHKREGAHQP
jgi:hypothetical protein